MQGVQILSITFILLMLYLIRIHYKKSELPKIEAVIWSALLIVLGVVVTFKQSADFVRNLFVVTRLADVITIIALMGSFVLLIENRVQINKLRMKLEKIVRTRAINNPSK